MATRIFYEENPPEKFGIVVQFKKKRKVKYTCTIYFTLIISFKLLRSSVTICTKNQ